MNFVVGGWFLIAILVLTAGSLASEGVASHHRSITSVLAGAVATWLVLIRPKLVLTRTHAVLCNVIRDVHIPWSQIVGATARWNMRVVTDDGRSFGAWAISSERPGGDPVIGGGSVQPGFRTQHVDPAVRASTVSPRAAGFVCEVIEDNVAAYHQAVADGTLPDTHERVKVSPAWSGIVALVLTTTLVVITFLT